MQVFFMLAMLVTAAIAVTSTVYTQRTERAMMRRLMKEGGRLEVMSDEEVKQQARRDLGFRK